MDCSYFSGDQLSRILPDTLRVFFFLLPPESEYCLIVTLERFTDSFYSCSDERSDYERYLISKTYPKMSWQYIRCHRQLPFRHIIFMFISYCLIIIALVQRLQRSVGHQQPPSAACTAYVCSSGVYSLYWIKGNNVAWFYVETNMRLNRIRHRHYPLSNTLTK